MASLATTLIDRFIGALNPNAGMRRLRAREMLTRAYEGASQKDGWRPRRAGASGRAGRARRRPRRRPCPARRPVPRPAPRGSPPPPAAAQSGAVVRVFNQRGEYHCKAVVSPRARPGVVNGLGVWWRKYGLDGTNVNELTSQALTDMGAGPTFYDCRVQVQALATP